MWSMCAWEMNRKSCATARCGHRPISKASFSDGKMTQVSCPAMDNPSTGYPSINNFLPVRVSPVSCADTSWALESLGFLGFPSIVREPNSPVGGRNQEEELRLTGQRRKHRDEENYRSPIR